MNLSASKMVRNAVTHSEVSEMFRNLLLTLYRIQGCWIFFGDSGYNNHLKLLRYLLIIHRGHFSSDFNMGNVVV